MNYATRKIILTAVIFLLLIIAFAKKQSVVFKYTPNVVPQSVALAGSFNNWSNSADMMNDDDDDGIWSIELELEDGEYHYKFVINGENWYQDINNPLSAPDGYGGRNSIIRVGDYGKFQQPASRGDGKILADAIYHEMDYPYFILTDDSMAEIKLRTRQDDIDSAFIMFNGKRWKMDWFAFDGTFDYYIAEVSFGIDTFEYEFVVYDSVKTFKYSENFNGAAIDFPIFYMPKWISTAIFYQVFPERFANGDPSNDPENVQLWGGIPEYHNFFGGDIKGIIDNLDYLSELGITALYLNPIFEAPSNHKYDMSDPMKIDPHFGDSALFVALLDSCHRRGIYVMLDGVFHDTGREHWAFQDVIQNGRESPYVNWYNIYSFPVGPENKPNYECWWGFGSLPSLVTTNHEVREYLFEKTRYWTKLGIDGWRLDCPNEVEDEFWLYFRRKVHSINNECYILGEIWGDGSKYLKGDMFDAVMNYRFRDACLDFFAFDRITSSEFAEKYFSMLASYYPIVNHGAFNLLGSHDTKRFLTLCEGDKQKLKLAWFFQMTMLGAPSIYYGDEIGMEGGKDPDCRRCFIWDESKQDRELLDYMKQLIATRKRHKILALGDVFKFETPDDDNIIFHKKFGDNVAIIVINNSDKEAKHIIQVPKRYYTDLITGQTTMVEFDSTTITVPAKSGKAISIQ